MGLCASSVAEPAQGGFYGQDTTVIPLNRSASAYKNFRSLDEVQLALRAAGLEACQLILGIDMTKSNLWTGKYSFQNRSLHDLTGSPNPYEQVISIIGRTLKSFDDDGQIPLYGFGDVTTTDRAVFSFKTDGKGAPVPCDGFDDALTVYRQKTATVKLSGPTSFVAIINKAIEIVKEEGGYQVLIIIADGGIDDVGSNAEAIVRASHYAISIIMVGVGDGSWDTMKTFDSNLPARRFDNFCFVPLSGIMNDPKIENVEAAFAMAALQEVPAQYQFIKRNRLVRQGTGRTLQGSSQPGLEGGPPGGM